MFVLLPILFLLAAPLLMFTVRVWRPRFAYFWLIAASAAVLAWPLMLLAHRNLPFNLPLTLWQPGRFFPTSPSLLVDGYSWPYALCLTTLVLAVILTDVVHAAEADWLAWASSLFLAGLGLLAVLAGNLLTLLMAWAAIDLVEVVLLLGQMMQSTERSRVVMAFSIRITGIVMVIWAGMVAASTGSGSSFPGLTQEVSAYLLAAAALRLGVLPLHLPFAVELPLRRSLGAMLRLVPAASSLALLARAGQMGAAPDLASLLLGISVLVGIYAGVAWISAKDELDGRPFWILGMAMLALTSAVRAQPAASLAWGVAMLLSGGLLFLASVRHRNLLPLLLLGLLGSSTLPFTPAWDGARLYSAPFNPLVLLMLLPQALLLAGYVRHALRPSPPPGGMERWVWLIYPWGLALLPLSHFLISWLGRPGVANGQEFPDLLASWPGLAALLGVGLLALLARRGIHFPHGLNAVLREIFSFNWLYRFLDGLYRQAGRAVKFINMVLEGEGGILWTLLLLTLLLSLLAQQGLGG